MMKGDLVVGFSDSARQRFDSTVVPLVRHRAKGLIVLAAILALLIAAAYLAAIVQAGFSLRGLPFLVLLVVPAAMVVLAVRRLGDLPQLGAVALTVTPTHVVFDERGPIGMLPIRHRRAEWDRSATKVTIIPANGILPARVAFAHQDRRQRRHTFAVDALDVPIAQIVAAIEA